MSNTGATPHITLQRKMAIIRDFRNYIKVNYCKSTELIEEFGSSLLKAVGKSSHNGIKEPLLVFKSNFQRNTNRYHLQMNVYITIKFHICVYTFQ